MIPETMRTIAQSEYGTTADLVRAPVPKPGPGEVLVEVAAAGVDRGTWHLMTGLPYVVRLGTGLRGPRRRVPGRDLAGTVAAVGSGVTRFAVGDKVLGIGRGAFAEFAIAPESKLVHMPASLSFGQAAALPISGLTALQAVVDAGRVQKGHKVLVLGASGGVGSFAVQIAKAAGAEVTGVCSGAKADLVGSLGADRVVAYDRGESATVGDYDLVIDIGGRRPVRALRRLASDRGTVVIVGGEGGGRIAGGVGRQIRAALLSRFVRQRLLMMLSKESATDLQRLVALVESAGLTPAVDREFALEDASAAVEHVADGRARGKVVVGVAVSRSVGTGTSSEESA